MGHKLRNTLYITSTENPIVHPASQDLPIGDGLRRLEMGCQKGASESSYTRPVFPNMDLQREIEDFVVCFLCESVFWRCVSVIHDEKNGAPKRER